MKNYYLLFWTIFACCFSYGIDKDALLSSSLSLEQVKQHIKEGADINAKCSYGCTPLHYCKNPETAKALIEAGADVNAKNNYGYTPLHYPNNTDVAKALIGSGANLFIKDNYGQTAFQRLKNDNLLPALTPTIKEKNYKLKVQIKDKCFVVPLHEVLDSQNIVNKITTDDNDNLTVDLSGICTSDLAFKINRLPNNKILELFEKLSKTQLKALFLDIDALQNKKLGNILLYLLLKNQIAGKKNFFTKIYSWLIERLFNQTITQGKVILFTILNSAYQDIYQAVNGCTDKELAMFLHLHKYVTGKEFDISSDEAIQNRYNNLSDQDKNLIVNINSGVLIN